MCSRITPCLACPTSGTAVEQEVDHATDITLGKYTAEPMKHIQEVPDRSQQNTRLLDAKGGKPLAFYGLLGAWDMLVITELPDEKSAMNAL